MRAVVVAVGEFPQMNARFKDDEGVDRTPPRRPRRHRHADGQGPDGPGRRPRRGPRHLALAAEVARLSAAARDGTVTLDELHGSTITITSLGALGGIVTTPVINYPEVAIIGVNKIVTRPVFADGAGCRDR